MQAANTIPQGFAEPCLDRLPLPDTAAMTQQQQEAAAKLIAGPRKGVYGPFLPLLRSPQLLDHVAQLGAYLRFESVVPERIRELVTCAVAREVTNQFEWLMHAPLALKAGVSTATLEALSQGAFPRDLPADEYTALDFTVQLLTRHGLSEPTWQAAVQAFGEQGAVELSTLIGYFVMVSWVMNAAHTPGRPGEGAQALRPFPL